jgi:hypothetical protein
MVLDSLQIRRASSSEWITVVANEVVPPVVWAVGVV